jgi:hypothetical protein
MSPSTPERETRENEDLPYGPLPVRSGQPSDPPSESIPLDQLVDLSWLTPEAPSGPAETVDEMDATAEEEDAPESATGMSLTSPRPETDDDVHFGVAARALGVSRKTVERMVKRGQLERGPSNAPATVSKRALVAVLEQRRRNVSHLTGASEIEKAKSGRERLSRDSQQDPAAALRELLLPALAPLLDEFVAARTRAAILENRLESIRTDAERERMRDELQVALATRGWLGRRKTRKALLHHYVLGDDHPHPGSKRD